MIPPMQCLICTKTYVVMSIRQPADTDYCADCPRAQHHQLAPDKDQAKAEAKKNVRAATHVDLPSAFHETQRAEQDADLAHPPKKSRWGGLFKK
jgi:hypothetical protein